MGITRWAEDFLQSTRMMSDPFANQFVAELAETKSKKELYLIMKFLLDESVWVDAEDLDPPSAKYFAEASILPNWANPELIKKGELFFALHAPEIAMVLLMKSLPTTYCCWRGAQVLHDTGRFTSHSGNLHPFVRRLMETSKFVLNAMSEDGLQEHGLAVKAAVKVRTLHAFIRHFLNDKDWDTAKFDLPINQEDMAGTMLAFSVFVIEGLERLGIRASNEEKNAYFHVWRIMGHLLGVQEDLIPESYEDASKLGHAILNHQKGGSDAGTELTGACTLFLKRLVPIRILRFLPENLMYFLMEPEFSKMVGVKRSKNPFVQFFTFLTITFFRVAEWLKDHVGFIRRIAKWLNPKILDYIIKRFLKMQGTPFTPKIIQGEVDTITRKRF